MGGVLGIAAEYDPFHNGHLYHLDESKRITGAEYAVCVMSGEFSQRGNPTYYNKHLRAEAAVRNGIDIVFELPFVYACNNAEFFAKGAMDILDGLGCVDTLSFGSESADRKSLIAAAELLAENSADLNDSIRAGMDKGYSYPRSRSLAISELSAKREYPEETRRSLDIIAHEPNDILGVEYLRRLILLKSKMEFIAVKRFACGEHGSSKSEGVAGATVLREMLAAREDIADYIPEATQRVLKDWKERGYLLTVLPSAMLPFIAYATSIQSRAELAAIFSASEGLENRLAAAAQSTDSYEALIRRTKTKRYTQTRIQRLATHTLIGLTKEAMAEAENAQIYARVLAFSQNGARLLKHIRKTDCASLPIISNPNKQLEFLPECEPIYCFANRAADVYRTLATGKISGYDDSRIPPAALLT